MDIFFSRHLVSDYQVRRKSQRLPGPKENLGLGFGLGIKVRVRVRPVISCCFQGSAALAGDACGRRLGGVGGGRHAAFANGGRL